MDVVANNMANASTTGFKREGIEFETYLTQPAPGQSINFVVDKSTYRDTSTGAIKSTGNPLDLAIEGKGYFQVQTASGMRYSRGGSFQVDNQGQLVTQSGNAVLGDGGQSISIPDNASDINISSDGYITAKVGAGSSLTNLGKVTLVNFDNEQALQSEGNGLYSTSQNATPYADGRVVQGAIEESNVSPVIEMTQMLHIMSAYEQATHMISQENMRANEAITRLSKTSA